MYTRSQLLGKQYRRILSNCETIWNLPQNETLPGDMQYHPIYRSYFIQWNRTKIEKTDILLPNFTLLSPVHSSSSTRVGKYGQIKCHRYIITWTHSANRSLKNHNNWFCIVYFFPVRKKTAFYFIISDTLRYNKVYKQISKTLKKIPTILQS